MPWLYRLVRDRSAQSTVIGAVLVVAMTILGTGVIVVVGSSSLDATHRQAAIQQSGQSMTLVDSRAAEVGLGTASTQTVRLGDGGDGQYSVRPNAGRITVTHINYTDGGHNETIYDGSLGSFVYENGDTTVAYQGGGVWRTRDNGTAMLSPPEFHYRQQTLTLPLVTVSGGGGGGGVSQVTLSSKTRARHVYPNASDSYDGIDRNYSNPVENGTVHITIQSEHYRGWKQYFEKRTDGDVYVSGPNEVTVVLTASGSVGPFGVPAETDSLDVTGMPSSGTPVSDFSLTLQAGNDGRNFENLHWSMYHDGAAEDFELHLYSSDKCNGGSYDGTLDVSVYYRNAGESDYLGWQNSSIDPDETSHFEVDCSDNTLHANFTGDDPMEFKSIDTSGDKNKWYFGDDIKSRSVASEETMYGTTYQSDQAEAAPMSDVVNHYFTMLASQFSLTVADGPGGSSSIDEGESNGALHYSGGTDEFVTYLHITENEVEVRFG